MLANTSRVSLYSRFSQRRISRSLVTVIALTLFNAVGFTSTSLPRAAAAIVTTGTCSVDGTNMTTSNIIDTTGTDGACTIRLTSGTSSFLVPSGVNSVTALIVGGGGGGGFGGNGGGGGAGAVITSDSGVTATPGSVISGTIGNGGTSGYVSSSDSTWTKGGKGADSSLTINSATYIASGGGGGSSYGNTADSGGSGGGKAINGSGPGSAYNFDYTGWTERVFAGASHSGVGGGGGGGAGGSPATNSSNGGIGVTIWGYSVGGGGSGWSGGNATVAAPFGGGSPRDSSYNCPSSTCHGDANTGGGGGGGGAGGSGLIVIKFVPARGQGTIAQTNGFQVNRTSTFTFTRTGTVPSSTTVSYQWQVKPAGSNTWSNVSTGSGGTTLTYQTPILAPSDNGSTYRIAVTDTQATYGISTTTFTETSVQPLFTPPGSDTDTALSLNGTSQFAEVTDTTGSIFDMTGTFTLQAWVRPADACPGSGAVISKNVSYMLYCQAGKWMVMALANGTSGTGDSTSIDVEANEWHHIAISKSSTSGNILFYYDGVLVQTIATGVTTMTPNNNPFRIGQYTGSYFFKGQIDQVQVYNTQRTQTQIAADINFYGLINESALMAYYDFNEGAGSTLYNREVGATSTTDLSITGSPTWPDVKWSSTTVIPAYTIVKFDRTYITSNGGWRAPSGVSRVSALVVAGGGGGGSRHGGGGGAGGLAYGATYPIESSSVYSVVVGSGGLGYGQPGNAAYMSGTTFVTSKAGPAGGPGAVGGNSFLRLASSSTESITALGGGAGSGSGATGAGGSGGGSNQSISGGTATQYSGTNWIGYGNPGGQGSSGSCSTDWCGGGGGGAGATGGNGNASSSASGGVGGVGRSFALESTTAIFYAGGGGGGSRNGTSTAVGGSGGGGAGGRAAEGISATYATGGGGGGGGFDGSTDYRGGNGGSGVIIIRWITALKPSFTPPTISYLNAGMTETFTTNVAQDSATVTLTRTFRWESSTTGVNGAYSVIKQGTGASNAFFSWVPMDTATSGSTFAYRVVVTDSDTAGLFIVETSTPVWAIINRALNVSGSSSFGKAINLAKSETYTITLGTSTYRPTLSPVIPGITLDTSTAGLAIIRIAETMTVGTYYETLTVTDSVSAVVTIPLTIRVASPPSLLNTGEIVDNDLIYHLDAGNSQSLILGDTAVATSAVWRDLSGNGKHAQTSGTYDTGGFAKTCTAPTWSPNNGGSLAFNGTSTCYWSPYLGNQLDLNVSVEAWVRLDGATLNSAAVIVQQNFNTSVASNISYVLGDTDQIGSVKFGLWDGGAYRQSGGVALTQGVWTHLVGTYDGTNFRIYKDGSLINTSANYTAGLGSTINTSGTLIGRRGSSSGSPFFNGSMASIRIYSKALSLAQIQQNYNATKERFLSGNTSMLRPSQKYGQNRQESFTVTSGFGSKTTTFTTGNRTGIVWDTATANTVVLAVQESLTVGTYSDTITVTDSLNQSSFLPIRMSIAKADTITVTVRNPKTLVYTGSPAASLPDIAIVGLVSSDTGTATRVYSAPASGVGATDTYTALVRSSIVPTDVETYTVTGDTLTSLSVGSLSNYQGVIYETSTLTISKARQPALLVNLYGAVAGTPFTLRSYGGAGTGAFSETITAGSTAANCSITGRVLSNTSSSNETRTCVVLVTRATSRNYLVETATATIYFFAFVINQPSQVGSGPNIGLSGATSITLDPNQAPTITGLSTTTLSLSSGGNFTISGAGFGLTPITVKFWRNKEILVTSSNGTSLVIPISSISALNPTTGKVLVVTSNGTAVSIDTLTITP